MVLLKILFFAFLIYYLLKSVIKFILPPIFREMGNNIGGQNQKRYANRKKEGEVTIQYQAKKGKSISKDVGEYVDFEEIKDEPSKKKF